MSTALFERYYTESSGIASAMFILVGSAGQEQTERGSRLGGSDWGRSRSSDRGQSMECGGSEMRQWRSALSFYSTCTAP